MGAFNFSPLVWSCVKPVICFCHGNAQIQHYFLDDVGVGFFDRELRREALKVTLLFFLRFCHLPFFASFHHVLKYFDKL